MLTRPLTQPLTGPLVRGVGEGGVGLAWAGALPALRTFVTANYNQPNPHNQAVMASPPTVTVPDATTPSGLTAEYKYSDSTGAFIRYSGGADEPNGVIYRRAPVTTAAAAGSTVTGVSWRAKFVSNGAKVSVSMQDSGGPVRFIVDGQYVSTAGTAMAGTGGRCYFQLDFGSASTRTIMVEGHAADAFEKIGGAPGDTFSAVYASPNKRMILLGDSFVYGSGAPLNGDGLAIVAGDMLGVQDTWASGIGGTGYVATNSGTKYKLSQRLDDANLHGPWDVIVVAMGVNDIGMSGITSEVTTCLPSLRSNNPRAQIFVVGPWDINAPSAPVANYAATKSAIQAGIPAGAGITFLDPQGVNFTKFTDSFHPDTAGHATLGAWLALQIKTALGA